MPASHAYSSVNPARTTFTEEQKKNIILKVSPLSVTYSCYCSFLFDAALLEFTYCLVPQVFVGLNCDDIMAECYVYVCTATRVPGHIVACSIMSSSFECEPPTHALPKHDIHPSPL